jgi:Pyrimidine reductase, riboflavin biosynthesis
VFTEADGVPKDNVEYVRLEFNSGLIGNILSELDKRGVRSLMVEGGAKLLGSFIETGSVG